MNIDERNRMMHLLAQVVVAQEQTLQLLGLANFRRYFADAIALQVQLFERNQAFERR